MSRFDFLVIAIVVSVIVIAVRTINAEKQVLENECIPTELFIYETHPYRYTRVYDCSGVELED